MNRQKLLKKICQQAQRAGLRNVRVFNGGVHDQLKIGGKKIPIPRHREIPEWTAEDIMKECEEFFGKGWWRK